MMIDFLNQMEIPYIIVATKVDKLNKTDRNKQLEAISNDEILAEGTTIIPFSSHTGEGKTELLKEIFKYTNL
jgi:GTP-binding protein